ncbi:phytoene desaturase family protein [Perlucidibaca aquatica]|jgi:all-trans-retinol 13,14-reductase|uniref:phytoene desaturase family protein n=1 Tax=Perlucidibaca aquatica TaxID=1852776 RepID=UPI000839FBF6|nr:NAD(P)/FAD-dependent oxidoreductase [Perlucidibaca aquatica]
MRRSGRRYRSGRAAEHYDVIVIGSGIGGLSLAALMSKLGKRVCVLEQHYTAGGFTHSYEREGFEWDVGVHYIGEVHKPHSTLRRLFDVISDGALKWAPMDPVYDRIIIGDRRVDFVEGRGALADNLIAQFPAEEAAIRRYIELIDEAARSAQKFFAGQAMPRWLGRTYHAARPLLVPKNCFRSVREVLEELTQDQELIGVLTGQWGDYGMVPRDASFLMHATVVKHYFGGGSYPVGGSWMIPDTIVPVIRAGGGEVFTYAKVEEIVIEKGRACGVRMANGDILRADQVVSAAGARVTYEQLLPEALRESLGYPAKLKQVKTSGAHLCIYAGFKGTAAELGLPKTNLWIYPSAHHEANVEAFQADVNAPFPMLYVSFPSAKDPEWDSNYPGKSTVEVLTMAPWEWFEKWQDTTWGQRGEDYDTFKANLQQRLLEALFKELPQLREALVYAELSTPLSTAWFGNYPQGEIYGLDHDVERFRQTWLHPITPIPGLALTGQDVVTAGVGGALMAGMLTTCALMGRKANSVMDLLKNWQPTQQEAST